MSNDTIAQRKARGYERLTKERDNAIKRAEVAEAKIKELEDRDQRFSMREPTALRDQLSKAEARAAQLKTDNDEMQSYINEIRVALHTEKDELTIDAVRRVISERDTAWSELREIREAIHADENEATSDEVRRVVAELARKLEQAQQALIAVRDWFARNTKQGHTPGPTEKIVIDAIGSE